MCQPRIGYFVPQFPGQTHGFFWREIAHLEADGAIVQIISTRPPPAGIMGHDWSDAAIGRTAYLSSLKPQAMLPLLGPAALRPLRAPQAPPRRRSLPLLPYAAMLLDLCRAGELDHLHVHSCGRAALLAAMAHAMGGIPYSLSLHGPLKDYGPDQKFKWRSAAFGIVITDVLMEAARATLAGHLPARLVRQSMGVDTDTFRRETAYAPYTGEGPLRIFSCARLNLVKGHLEHVQAIRQLRDAGLSAELTIAGEDDAGGTGFRKALEAEIARLDLADHVTLLGAVDTVAVQRNLLHCHVFSLASWHEPLGVAYMEAMSCGVPTVGTDAGGVRELIRHGTDGILVPPRDVAALVSALERLARSPETATRLGAQGRTRVVDAFAARGSADTLRAQIDRTLVQPVPRNTGR